jgi:hypothetical protein
VDHERLQTITFTFFKAHQQDLPPSNFVLQNLLFVCCAASVVQFKLRLAALTFFAGCLTYEQLSRASVMCYPYTMRLLFLATEIMQQRDARLAAQQPQQQHQQQVS